MSNAVVTEAPYFVDLGLLAINASYEVNIFGTPATIIRNQTYGTHWSAPDHIFGGDTAVGMSTTRSEQDYRYKTDLGIWRENQDFGRQNISMSRPPLDSTPIDKNKTNRTTSPIESIPVRIKTTEPMLQHDQWNRQHYQRSRQNDQQNLQGEN